MSSKTTRSTTIPPAPRAEALLHHRPEFPRHSVVVAENDDEAQALNFALAPMLES